MNAGRRDNASGWNYTGSESSFAAQLELRSRMESGAESAKARWAEAQRRLKSYLQSEDHETGLMTLVESVHDSFLDSK